MSADPFLTQLFQVTILLSHNCPVIGDMGKESCPVVMFAIQTREFQDITVHLQLQEKYVSLCHFWAN